MNQTAPGRPQEGRLPLHESLRLWEKAGDIIPTGTQCLGKGPTAIPLGTSPLFLEKADGCHVWDVDGNRYVDYGMGLWSVTLGHGNPTHAKAVCDQVVKGCNYSLVHPIEYRLAERLVEAIPCAEMVRYGKNGSDVTTAAVRLARAVTGRDVVVRCGYHGWHDWYVCLQERDRGIPKFNRQLSERFDYNDIGSFRTAMAAHRGEVACVIMEGIQADIVDDEWLQTVAKETREAGALLVFDEIINGYRIELGGAHAYKHIDVDLATCGKGIANGSPLSALVGKREVMKELETVFFSFTFGGEMPSLAGALAVLEVYRQQDVIGHMWRIGGLLKDGLARRVNSHGLQDVVRVTGYPVRTIVRCLDESGRLDLIAQSILIEQMMMRGFLYKGYHALSLSHTEEIVHRTLDALDESLRYLKTALESELAEEFLKGRPICPVFRRH